MTTAKKISKTRKITRLIERKERAASPHQQKQNEVQGEAEEEGGRDRRELDRKMTGRIGRATSGGREEIKEGREG